MTKLQKLLAYYISTLQLHISSNMMGKLELFELIGDPNTYDFDFNLDDFIQADIELNGLKTIYKTSIELQNIQQFLYNKSSYYSLDMNNDAFDYLDKIIEISQSNLNKLESLINEETVAIVSEGEKIRIHKDVLDKWSIDLSNDIKNELIFSKIPTTNNGLVYQQMFMLMCTNKYVTDSPQNNLIMNTILSGLFGSKSMFVGGKNHNRYFINVVER